MDGNARFLALVTRLDFDSSKVSLLNNQRPTQTYAGLLISIEGKDFFEASGGVFSPDRRDGLTRLWIYLIRGCFSREGRNGLTARVVFGASEQDLLTYRKQGGGSGVYVREKVDCQEVVGWVRYAV